jgi:TatA/E family protein of Tat protein translocase
VFANLGWTHILILGGALFLLFGAKRFPEIGRNVGQGISNLYRGIRGALDEEPPSLRRGSNTSDESQ